MQLQLRNIINLPLSITIPFSLLIDLYIYTYKFDTFFENR